MKRAYPLLAASLLLLLSGFQCEAPEGEEHAHGGHAEHDEHDEQGGDKASGGFAERLMLAPEALARSGIETGPVMQGSVGERLELAAEVQLNPDREAHVAPLVEGLLLEVRATVGDVVEAGQPLVLMRSVALGQARAELIRANAEYDVAARNLARQESLRRDGISSERSLLDAQLAVEEARAEREVARSSLKVFGVEGGRGPDLTLASPIRGTVLERHATRGENVAPGDTLFIVADLSRLHVRGQASERDLARVRPGMAATLTLTAWPGRSWRGVVDQVAPVLDPGTRTVGVRVPLDNADGALTPGLFGALQLEAPGDEGPGVLVVPMSAIQTLNKNQVVFRVGAAPGEFHVVPVVLGRRDAERAEVLSGLKPGDVVAIRGTFILKSEALRGSLGHGHAH